MLLKTFFSRNSSTNGYRVNIFDMDFPLEDTEGNTKTVLFQTFGELYKSSQ